MGNHLCACFGDGWGRTRNAIQLDIDQEDFWRKRAEARQTRQLSRSGSEGKDWMRLCISENERLAESCTHL
jgi:hypothetical protein